MATTTKPSQQSIAARRRWANTSPEDRREATKAMIDRSVERRRLAKGVLAAIEAAGYEISRKADTEEVAK